MKNRLGGRLVEISACDGGLYKDAMANVKHPGVFKGVRVLILFVVPAWRRCPDFPPLSLEFAPTHGAIGSKLPCKDSSVSCFSRTPPNTTTKEQGRLQENFGKEKAVKSLKLNGF